MSQHEDIAVRGGVKLCREYIQFLKDENQRLQEKNELKGSARLYHKYNDNRRRLC